MASPVPRVRVLVLQHGLGALDYAVPDGLALAPGDVVRVPLGPRQIDGVVWEADRLPAKDVADAKLRAVMGGISSASFYAAFGSKEALFREALALYEARYGGCLDPLFDAAGRREAVRVSLQYYNTADDVRALVGALQDLRPFLI